MLLGLRYFGLFLHFYVFEMENRRHSKLGTLI